MVLQNCNQLLLSPGIGGRLGKQLEEIGIKTVMQLREVPELKLEKQFGKKICKMMKQMCLGIDHSPVIASGPPQVCSSRLFKLEAYYNIFLT